MEEKKHIELRSEKVRNVIGQVPPVLLRYGISIIGISLLICVVIAAFIPHQPDFDVDITIEQYPSGELIYKVLIPQEAMENKSEFNYVTINIGSELPIPDRLQMGNISDTAHISPNGIWYTATLHQEGIAPKNIKLEEPITIPAKIKLNKKSILKWMTRSL